MRLGDVDCELAVDLYKSGVATLQVVVTVRHRQLRWLIDLETTKYSIIVLLVASTCKSWNVNMRPTPRNAVSVAPRLSVHLTVRPCLRFSRNRKAVEKLLI